MILRESKYGFGNKQSTNIKKHILLYVKYLSCSVSTNKCVEDWILFIQSILI